MSGDATEVGRPYAGVDSESRRLARKERMLSAAFDIFGSREGCSQATVERICSQAGVATRSIYEEFGSRENLLLCIYSTLMSDAAEQVSAALFAAPRGLASKVGAAVDTYVRFMVQDMRRCRIAHLSMRYAGAWAEDARGYAITSFAKLLGPEIDGSNIDVSSAWITVRGYALAGAINEVLSQMARADVGLTVDEIIDELVDGFVAVLSGAHRKP